MRGRFGPVAVGGVLVAVGAVLGVLLGGEDSPSGTEPDGAAAFE